MKNSFFCIEACFCFEECINSNNLESVSDEDFDNSEEEDEEEKEMMFFKILN